MWRIGVAFLIGHCLIHSLSDLPALLPWAPLGLVTLLVAARLQSRAACALLLGLAWAWGHAAARLAGELPDTLEGLDLQVQGHVVSLPKFIGTDGGTDTNVQFELAVESAHCPDAACADEPLRVPPRIALAWYDHEQLPAPGEAWQLTVRLKRRNGFANPGGFDYEGHLFRAGIGASGYVRVAADNRRLTAPAARHAVVRLRGWIARRIEQVLGPSPVLGIIQGLAVGDTHAIAADQWRVFAATGTTHLLAISGLHISMVAALAAWLGGGIVRWRGAQALRLTAIHGQALAGAGAAFLYSLLAGWSVPTQRTLVMLAVYFVARCCQRHGSTADTLGIALIAVLLLDPFAPLAVGAWLSFGAVAIIALALRGHTRRAAPVANFARMQLLMAVGLAPLLIAAFGSLSLLAPLANAVAVPFFSFLIVPLVLLGALLAAVSLAAGSWWLGAVAWLLEQAWWVLQFLADQPLAVVYLPAPSLLVQLAMLCGAVLWVVPGIWPLKLVALMLCLPAFLDAPRTPQPGEFTMTVLDVGQGSAHVIETHRHVLVYDAGPAFRSGRDTGELVLLPYLRSRGIRHIDLLIVSHDDLDHRGGVRSLLAGLPVRRVMFGPSVRSAPSQKWPMLRQPCQRGLAWTWDAVNFDMQHPGATSYARDNDSSCVLRVAAAGGSVLLTGDIERAAEDALLAAGIVPSDIVLVPHHGSRTSSSAEFVAAVHARWAVVSAGYRNRWGMPKQDVVERWQASGAQLLLTSEHGAIQFTVGAHGIGPPRRYRAAERRYWWRESS
jgi:competence protein ComEC